jgi:hypothetical protein
MARRRTIPGAPRRPAGRPQVPFPHKLVLNQWLLSLFNVNRFEQLADLLRNEALEGLDENRVHHFHHALTSQLFNLTQLPTELLLAYDQNIVKHTLFLNDRRITRGEAPIRWKYFQYFALLFTEIYLDWYFGKPASLRTALNTQIEAYNADKEEADQLAKLDETVEPWTELNKVAYWMATGSGKTLLMHANILQYRHYLDKHGRQRELNRILLLTPNEGLSQQHLREFQTAGIEAELFNKDGRGLFAGRAVEIIDIHKLKDDMGDKTVAVDAFEGNNLVMVDEGHRGAGSGEEGAWMKFRNALCENGFSFEYSATFQQAVKGNKALTDLYVQSILFDYSYRYFYADGFGKEYQILNLERGAPETAEWLDTYLTACLLAFFQQQRLFRENEAAFRPFNIEKPLWIFVGGSVTKTISTREASDIVEILKFLGRFTAHRTDSIRRIDQVLNHGVVTQDGKNLFTGRFAPINTARLNAEQVFTEILATLFNAPAGGQLYIELLKGADGEVALRLGADNEPFGVINVGEAAKLVKLCDEQELATGEREFAGSLFHEINEDHSPINILIGAKRFTEGWNSWRVSTMGLMNVGQGEGAQIIQLFGRGVRLKGYGISLKRSKKAQLPDGIARPKYLDHAETLGIFGIHADYMAQFRDFLKEEGLPANQEMDQFILPVVHNLTGTQKLKTIRLKKTINGYHTEFGDAFRKLAPVPTLAKPDVTTETAYLQRNKVVLNWYPKIQAMQAAGLGSADVLVIPHATRLRRDHVAFLDLDRLFFELQQFKAERGWYNLNLSGAAIADLLTDSSWYDLLIPEEQLALTSFDRIRLWQDIATALLRKYVERYYTFRKKEWELPHLEYQVMTVDDPNLLKLREGSDEAGYRVMVDKSEEEIVRKLEELKDLILTGRLQNWSFRGLKAMSFGQHLYQPVLFLDEKFIEISPVPLNTGEWQFVEDLKRFHDHDKAALGGKELYLLRNLSKGRGVGFFEAGNFHPDFILWLVDGFLQRILFLDPKGIRHLGLGDPKLKFHETIKEIESRLGDPSITLDSYLLSNTPSHEMQLMWSIDKAAMRARHILFPEEDHGSYLRDLLL